jgi:predicted phosphodiesterase
LGGAAALVVVVGCGGENPTPDSGANGDADLGDGDTFEPIDADQHDSDPVEDADPDSLVDADDASDAEAEADVEIEGDAEVDADPDEDLPPAGPGPLVLLHITDTHVGEGAIAAVALDHALREVRPVIRPALTIASGDLVDEGYESDMWETYERVTGVVTADEYMEVPGNHDTHFDTELNNYLARSITGRATGATHGHRVIEAGSRRLRVVGVNTASADGRLQNLTGFLEGSQVDELIASIDADPTVVDDTIIVGHHPLRGINGLELQGTAGNLRRLIDHTEAAAYLFGHIHLSAISWVDEVLHLQGPTLGKPSMISEAGYFIVGYDELGLSAREVRLEVSGETVSTPWPVVLITLPVDSSLGRSNPHSGHLPRSSSGNLLRACVFCPDEPDDVSFRVNGSPWMGMDRVSSWYQAEFDTDAGASVTIEVRALAEGRIDSQRIQVPLG